MTECVAHLTDRQTERNPSVKVMCKTLLVTISLGRGWTDA